jgi:hypothetical protein
VVKGMRFADASRSGPVQLVGAAMAAATDTPAPSVIRRLSLSPRACRPVRVPRLRSHGDPKEMRALRAR